MKRSLLSFLLILILIIACAIPAYSGGHFNYPKFQAFDWTGDFCNGCKLYTYKSGTSTAKATYTTSGMSTANANPVILDSRGEATIYGEGSYKFVLKDSNDVQIWSFDPITVSGGAFSSYYFADSLAADHGAASGDTIYTYLTNLGTTKPCMIVMSHDPGSGTGTDYDWDTTRDISSYVNAYFYFEPGAYWDQVTGDEVVTIDTLDHVIWQKGAKIFDGDMVDSSTGGTAYPEMWQQTAGDGSTDCTTAIEYASNASASGGTIFYTPGRTYAVASQIDVTKALTHYGYGATIKKITGCTGRSLYIYGTSGSELSGVKVLGLSFDGNSIGSGTSSNLVLAYCDDFTTKDIRSYDSGYIGISHITCDYGTIENITSDNDGTFGVAVQQCTYVKCSDIDIKNLAAASGSAFQFKWSSYCELNGFTIYNCTKSDTTGAHGVNIRGSDGNASQHIVVSNGIINGVDKAPIYVHLDDDTAGSAVSDITISDIDCTDHPNWHITIAGYDTTHRVENVNLCSLTFSSSQGLYCNWVDGVTGGDFSFNDATGIPITLSACNNVDFNGGKMVDCVTGSTTQPWILVNNVGAVYSDTVSVSNMTLVRSSTSYGDYAIETPAGSDNLVFDNIKLVNWTEAYARDNIDVGRYRIWLDTNGSSKFYLIGEGELYRDNANNATSAGGEDDLASVSIESDTIGAEGGMRITAAGTITGANDTKTIKLYFGATSVTVVSAAAGDTTDWRVVAEIWNTATNAQRWSWIGTESDGTTLSGYDTSAIDTTGDATLKLTGQCANVGDTITQTMFLVERFFHR